MTHNDEFLKDVHAGLSSTPKSLSPKWLYDDRGSALFEDITQVAEYYPTRTEAKIFETVIPALRDRFGTGGAIIEYGSGASVKTRALLDHISPDVYVPIDIAEDFLLSTAQDLRAAYPPIAIEPVVGDFSATISLPSAAANADHRLGFFPGSTIGNMSPPDAVDFLARARQSLGPGSWFLLGADLVKDIRVLEAAYDDADGITAAFNLNLFTRMNRELAADIDLTKFRHRAVFNQSASRIEMHLVAQEALTITIDGKSYHFAEGETLHTENSYKFTSERIDDLAARSGWSIAQSWTDAKGWFGVFLLKNGAPAAR